MVEKTYHLAPYLYILLTQPYGINLYFLNYNLHYYAPPRGPKSRGVADRQRGGALVFLGRFSVFCIPSRNFFVCQLESFQ